MDGIFTCFNTHGGDTVSPTRKFNPGTVERE
jgi:hypothetical protein